MLFFSSFRPLLYLSFSSASILYRFYFKKLNYSYDNSIVVLFKFKTTLMHLVTTSLTFKYYLDLEVTLVKHTPCTSSQGTLQLYQVIKNCHQPFKSNSAETQYNHTMFNIKLNLDIEPTLVKHTHCISTHHI